MTRRILSGLAVSSVALVANAEPTLLTNIPPKNTPVDHLLDDVDIAGGDIAMIVSVQLPGNPSLRSIRAAATNASGMFPAGGDFLDTNGDDVITVAARGKADILIESATDDPATSAFMGLDFLDLNNDGIPDAAEGPGGFDGLSFALAAFEAPETVLLAFAEFDAATAEYFNVDAAGLGSTVSVVDGVATGANGLLLYDLQDIDGSGGIDFEDSAALLELIASNRSASDAFLYSGEATITDAFGARITLVPAPGAAGLLGLTGFAATRRRR